MAGDPAPPIAEPGTFLQRYRLIFSVPRPYAGRDISFALCSPTTFDRPIGLIAFRAAPLHARGSGVSSFDKARTLRISDALRPIVGEFIGQAIKEASWFPNKWFSSRVRAPASVG